MSRLEKLQAMHLLWEDLALDENAIESPLWHQEALEITSAEVRAGRIREIDWEVAKQELRDRVK